MISAALVKELREKTGAGMMDCKKALVETNGNIEDAITWLREKGISKAVKKEGRIAAEGICTYAVKGDKAVLFELNSETDFVAKNQTFLDLAKNVGEAILSSGATCTDCALEAEYNGTKVKDLIINATATIGEKISLRRVNVFEKTASQVFGAYSHMGGKIAVLLVLEGNDEVVAKDICMHIAAMNPSYLDSSKVDQATIEKEKEILTQEALNEGKPANIVEKMVVGRIHKYLKEICLVDQPFVKNQDMTVGAYAKSKGCAVVSYLRLAVGEGIEKRQDDFVAEVMAAVNK